MNNGNGEFSFLFALVHKHIQVVAVEQEEDKVALARNCAGLPDNLTVYRESELPKDREFETVFKDFKVFEDLKSLKKIENEQTHCHHREWIGRIDHRLYSGEERVSCNDIRKERSIRWLPANFFPERSEI
jgi:hypothetical protein